MWLEADVVERLADAGKKFGRGTPQQVVEEIIDLYFPLWSSVNVSTQRTIDAQKNRIESDYDVAEVDDFDKRKGSKAA